MAKLNVVVVLIVFSFLGVPAYAKSKQQSTPQVSVNDIIAKMKTQLQLTDKQLEAIKPIIDDYLAKEKQLKLEEKKQLGKVLTGDQMYTWNFLQNEVIREKKKR